VLAALREWLPRTAWSSLLVQPETVLGWHRELVRRRWAAYRERPRRGRPPVSEECRELIVRVARENSRWGCLRIRGELLKLGYTEPATTIRSVLKRARVPPARRRSQLTFLAARPVRCAAPPVVTVLRFRLRAPGRGHLAQARRGPRVIRRSARTSVPSDPLTTACRCQSTSTTLTVIRSKSQPTRPDPFTLLLS